MLKLFVGGSKDSSMHKVGQTVFMLGQIVCMYIDESHNVVSLKSLGYMRCLHQTFLKQKQSMQVESYFPDSES